MEQYPAFLPWCVAVRVRRREMLETVHGGDEALVVKPEPEGAACCVMTEPVARVTVWPAAEAERRAELGLVACEVIELSRLCAGVSDAGSTIACTELALAESMRIENGSMLRASARSERKLVSKRLSFFALPTSAPETEKVTSTYWSGPWYVAAPPVPGGGAGAADWQRRLKEARLDIVVSTKVEHRA